MNNLSAKENLDRILGNVFASYGFPFETNRNVIPNNDPTTLFISAGMQPLKSLFQSPDGSSYGSTQYCVRTNDIDLVGDGVHLTFFQMVGSFGFGTCDYRRHCKMWTQIMRDLGISISHVCIHPSSQFEKYWDYLLPIKYDQHCIWTDGNVGGYCSELYTPDGLEVGNLVNPLGHSVDVGFGYERMLQIIEGKNRVDETSLFRQDLDPISRDHFRTLSVFHNQSIFPGNKGRNYVCRRLMRRFIRLNPINQVDYPFSEWYDAEKTRMKKSIRNAQRYYRRNGEQSELVWWDSFGVMPEELYLIRQ